MAEPVKVALTHSSIPAQIYGGQFDHLPLPGGGTIGSTPDTQVLRRVFARIGIEGAHRDGRETICGRYSRLLHEIGNEAKNRAVEAWLEQYKE
jgi:hypothetical protein